MWLKQVTTLKVITGAAGNSGQETVIKTTDRDLAMGAVLCCCCLLVAKSFQALETPWAVTHQVPLSMGLSRQGYWCE